MDTTAATLDTARDQVAATAAVIDEWSTKADKARGELADVEARAGTEALAGRAEQAQAQIVKLRTEAEVADRATAAATDQHAGARRAAVAAAAGHVRHRAEQIRSEADAHEARTTELLAALEDHEGQTWRPVAELSDPIGGATRSEVRPTTAETMRARATDLEALATELTQLAQGDVSDQMLEKSLRRADPDGPEAEARREHDARNAERQEAVQAERRAQAEAIADWKRDHAAHLETNRGMPSNMAEQQASSDWRTAVREHGSVDAALEASTLSADREPVPA